MTMNATKDSVWVEASKSGVDDPDKQESGDLNQDLWTDVI